MSNGGRHGEVITDRRLASATFVVSIAGARLATPSTEAVRWTSTMVVVVVVVVSTTLASAILTCDDTGEAKCVNKNYACRTHVSTTTSSPPSIFQQVKLRWSAWSRVQRASAERSKFTASEDEELIRCRLHDRLVCAS